MLTLIFEFVGFLVILYVLYRYAVPRISTAMDKQRQQIREQLVESEAAAKRRQEAEDAYNNAVTEARVDAAKIRDDARADAQKIEEEMRAFAEREVVRIRERGEEQLALHRQQLTRELRAEVGRQAAELAGRLVREHLSDDTRRAATVDRFLDELDGMSAETAAKGGS